jgi:two-component system chemotaxis response regulator CheB
MSADMPIRVLITDDSAVMRAALSRMLESSPRIEVCGTARDGLEAVEKNRLLKPDVITLDVEMPMLDGISALKQIMNERPCPVIMVSSMTQHGAEVTLEALDAGAFDYLPKEDLQRAVHALKIRQNLIEKIEAASRSPLATLKRVIAPPGLKVSADLQQGFAVVPKIVVIGTSTGGPKALQEVLPTLPPDLPVGVVVIQHMPPGFTGPFAKRLDGLSKLRIREARQGEAVEPGTVYIAPAGQHTTLFSTSGWKVSVCLSDAPHNTLHKPCVDVTMISVAQVFGRYAMGVILTGMGSDGLQGMSAIREAGGITIGQDEATCAVYGMPRCCAEQGVLQRIVPLSEIPGQILRALRYKAPAVQARAAAP